LDEEMKEREKKIEKKLFDKLNKEKEKINLIFQKNC
jgi:hypothetical protein